MQCQSASLVLGWVALTDMNECNLIFVAITVTGMVDDTYDSR